MPTYAILFVGPVLTALPVRSNASRNMTSKILGCNYGIEASFIVFTISLENGKL